MSVPLTEATPPIARAKADPATLRALEECLGKHRHRLLVYAVRRGATPQEAEDVVQDAIEAVLRGSRTCDNKTPFFAFMCGVVRSMLSNRARAAAKRPSQSPLYSDGDEMPTSRPNPEVVLVMLDELEDDYQPEELVAAARDTLAGTELAVFDVWNRGVSKAKEQAETLGIPVSAVMTARRGIQRKLLRLVEERREGRRGHDRAR